MTAVERVKRAIKMESPDRIPLIIYNRDHDRSDMVPIEVIHHFMGPGRDTSEFGFQWEIPDKTMGQPKEALIRELSEIEGFRFPDPNDPLRFKDVRPIMEKYGGKYFVANLSLTGFTIMTFLRGFEDTLFDIEVEPEAMNRLADGVFGFEEDVIRLAGGQGFHAVAFFDDWGTQGSTIISPKKWREFFKPRYRRQFELCHELGMDVYFHCCGYIMDIIGDFIEIGVDILNLSQPNIFDVPELGRRFGGKVCFMCPVSYQTTSLSGTREEIFADAKLLMDNLAVGGGGLIGYVEDYSSMGMSEENYQSCIDAFLMQAPGASGA